MYRQQKSIKNPERQKLAVFLRLELAQCLDDNFLIIQMIWLAGNADRTNHAGACEHNRHTAAAWCEVIGMQLAVLQRFPALAQHAAKAKRTHLHQFNGVALALQPQFTVRTGAVLKIPIYDYAIDDDREENVSDIKIATFQYLLYK